MISGWVAGELADWQQEAGEGQQEGHGALHPNMQMSQKTKYKGGKERNKRKGRGRVGDIKESTVCRASQYLFCCADETIDWHIKTFP